MGYAILFGLITMEVVFCVWNIVERDYHRYEKAIANISLLLLFIVLSVGSVIDWSMRYYMLALVLVIQAGLAARVIYKNTVKLQTEAIQGSLKEQEKTDWKTEQTQEAKNMLHLVSRSIWRVVGKSILYATALTLAILCPQYELVAETGGYDVQSFTWTYVDEDRQQPYMQPGSREVNVQFWYPDCENYDLEKREKYPLVIFSHGTYGVKLTNESLFRELASHGYVVCSLDHPYHSFFTINAEGKAAIVSMEYLNQYAEFASTVEANVGYPYLREWLEIRTSDMAFVLDELIADAKGKGLLGVSEIIDTETIIVGGHSMGGTAALALGRRREDIDAVISLEAPYFGDITGVENGDFTWLDEAYPVPTLHIYSDSSWGSFGESITYTQNERMLTDANTTNVYIEGTRHLGLTDLSLLCPMAVELLDGEKSKRDAHDVLMEINEEVIIFLENIR